MCFSETSVKAQFFKSAMLYMKIRMMWHYERNVRLFYK
jgi:hypothetical protein